MRLLLLIGPPAVGKMTVGREIARTSDFRLFHNHHTIEPLVEVFGYGTPPFRVLNAEFRRRVLEEAAAAGLDLVFTFVWDLADPAEAAYVEALVAPYVDRGGELLLVELAADLDTRLARNRGESRLADKPTKRDLAWSEANVRELEAHTLSTDPGGGDLDLPAYALLGRHPHLRIDTSELTARATAERVLAWVRPRT